MSRSLWISENFCVFWRRQRWLAQIKIKMNAPRTPNRGRLLANKRRPAKLTGWLDKPGTLFSSGSLAAAANLSSMAPSLSCKGRPPKRTKPAITIKFPSPPPLSHWLAAKGSLNRSAADLIDSQSETCHRLATALERHLFIALPEWDRLGCCCCCHWLSSSSSSFGNSNATIPTSGCVEFAAPI